MAQYLFPTKVEPPAIQIIRTAEYDAQLKKMLPNRDHRDIFDREVDSDLAADPGCGAVIVGSGGFRKMRAPRPDVPTSKRDGARVLYLHVPDAQTIFLVTVYAKSQADSVSPAGKRVLHQWAAELKAYKLIRPRRKPRTRGGL
ncbi:MAG: hypothetical protein ABI328_05710 [Gemmatimonadaceae bacterium]